MNMFLVAGHDTTGYTIEWIIAEVARNPKVYTKLKEEIDASIPSDVADISYNAANALPYLDMVIKEGMRLWPVAGKVRVGHLI